MKVALAPGGEVDVVADGAMWVVDETDPITLEVTLGDFPPRTEITFDVVSQELTWPRSPERRVAGAGAVQTLNEAERRTTLALTRSQIGLGRFRARRLRVIARGAEEVVEKKVVVQPRAQVWACRVLLLVPWLIAAVLWYALDAAGWAGMVGYLAGGASVANVLSAGVYEVVFRRANALGLPYLGLIHRARRASITAGAFVVLALLIPHVWVRVANSSRAKIEGEEIELGPEASRLVTRFELDEILAEARAPDTAWCVVPRRGEARAAEQCTLPPWDRGPVDYPLDFSGIDARVIACANAWTRLRLADVPANERDSCVTREGHAQETDEWCWLRLRDDECGATTARVRLERTTPAWRARHCGTDWAPASGRLTVELGPGDRDVPRGDDDVSVCVTAPPRGHDLTWRSDSGVRRSVEWSLASERTVAAIPLERGEGRTRVARGVLGAGTESFHWECVLERSTPLVLHRMPLQKATMIRARWIVPGLATCEVTATRRPHSNEATTWIVRPAREVGFLELDVDAPAVIDVDLPAEARGLAVYVGQGEGREVAARCPRAAGQTRVLPINVARNVSWRRILVHGDTEVTPERDAVCVDRADGGPIPADVDGAAALLDRDTGEVRFIPRTPTCLFDSTNGLACRAGMQAAYHRSGDAPASCRPLGSSAVCHGETRWSCTDCR